MIMSILIGSSNIALKSVGDIKNNLKLVNMQ